MHDLNPLRLLQKENKIQLDMSTARRRLKSPQSLSNLSTHPTIWPWNYKDKVLCVVKGKNHIVSPVSNWFAFFLFHINQITIPEIQLFWNLTLKNRRSRLWVSSKVKVTWFTQYPTDAPPFRFTSTGPTIIPNRVTLKKHIRNFQRKFGKKVSTRMPPKSNQVKSMTPGACI